MDLRHFSQSIKVIRPGNSTSPSLMASSNVAPSGLPATCFAMQNDSKVARRSQPTRPEWTARRAQWRAHSPAELSGRAASLRHAHARRSAGPSLRAQVGPRDGPEARARNPGQDTKCTLRSRFPKTAPNCRAVRLDLQPSTITADLFDARLGLSSQQCTLSAASDKGPRAATLRQTTLRLNCRAQLAQSTSKSLSQNIAGKLRINKACNNKQLVATHSHAQLSDALMHTHN